MLLEWLSPDNISYGVKVGIGVRTSSVTCPAMVPECSPYLRLSSVRTIPEETMALAAQAYTVLAHSCAQNLYSCPTALTWTPTAQAQWSYWVYAACLLREKLSKSSC